MRSVLSDIAPALAAALLTLGVRPTSAAIFTVSSCADGGVGSLRAAIDLANASPGFDTIQFAIPISDPGYDMGRGVFTIALASALPTATDSLFLDGYTQTAITGDTNGGRIGTGGTVGVGRLPLRRLDAPEIEISGGGTVGTGMRIGESGTRLRGIAMVGFRSITLVVQHVTSGQPISRCVIEECVFGSRADTFALPPDAPVSVTQSTQNIYLSGAQACTLRHNLIGFSGGFGIQMQRQHATGNLIEGNEFRGNARMLVNRDAFAFHQGGVHHNTLRGNLFADNYGPGVDLFRSDGDNVIIENTFSGNGVGSATAAPQETPAIRVFGDSRNVLVRNIIVGNHGAGVMVNEGGTRNTISENEIHGNGASVAADGSGPSGQLGIDLYPGSAERGRGEAPYLTPNDDGDGDPGPNDLINFPILTRVEQDGDSVQLEGFAPPGALVEVFVAHLSAHGVYGATAFGEGLSHVVTLTESGAGSGALSTVSAGTVVDPAPDEDAGVGAYSGDVGVASAAERFRFRLAIAEHPELAVGTPVTATATGTSVTAAALGSDAEGSTSEFSNVVYVVGPEICDNGLDDDGDGLVDNLDPDCYAQCRTVTNTNPQGNGSLAQAIKCANDDPGLDTIRFAIPTSDPGFDAARGVFRIELVGSLPPVTDPLLIDGRIQTAFTGNTNAVVLGAGGTVGVDGLPLGQVDGPEIEIYGPDSVNYGLRIREGGTTVRGLAIYGFGRATIEATGTPTVPITDVLLEDCIIGARAHAFELAPDATSVYDTSLTNVRLYEARSCAIRNNLIGFSGGNGITVNEGSTRDLVIEGNEFRGNGRLNLHLNAMRLTEVRDAVVRGNLVAANFGPGFDIKNGDGGILVENNTIRGNGLGSPTTPSPEWAGVLVFGSQPNTFRRNVVADNYGAGFGIGGEARGQLITENEVSGNGHVARPFDGAVSGQIGIDLTEAGPDYERGIAPYVTPNDAGDADAGPNQLFNFPVVESAQVVGTDLVVTGFAPAGAYLELFAAATGSSRTVGTTPFGQGERHILTLTEGGTGSGATHALAGSTVVDPLTDLDATTGAYAGDFGADSGAPRFRFEIPLAVAGGLGIGDSIVFTATATAATAAADGSSVPGTTSEFSHAVRIFEPEICDNGIDDDGDGLTDCEDPDCADAIADAGPDVTTCPGQPVVLRGTATAATLPIDLLWTGGTPGSDTMTVAPTTATEYVFTATNGHGCSHSDTVRVDVDDPGPSFTYVPADEVYACDLLTALLLAPDSARAVDGCGLPLEVTTSDSVVAGCGASETRYRSFAAVDGRGNRITAQQILTFEDVLAPVFVDAPLDTVVVDAADVPPARSLVAEDACGPAVTVVPTEDRLDLDDYTYEIVRTWEAIDECGNRAEVQRVVRVELPLPELLIFNGFSPNGDGVNDNFTLANLELYPNTAVKVFNRWGNEVYASDDYDNSWDGRWEDRVLPDGTYFYVVTQAGADAVAGSVVIRR